MTPVQSVRFTRIKAGSLFKLILILTATVMIPFLTLCGVAAFFGAHTVTVNQQYVTGIAGFFAALFMGSVLALLFSVFAWICTYVSIRMIGKFKPLTLDYVPVAPPAKASTEETKGA